MNKNVIAILIATALLPSLQTSLAGSATWNLNPTSGDWNTAANWTPETVPNAPTDIATFEASNITAISLSHNILLNSVVFSSDASAFTITVPARFHWTLNGLANNQSNNTQNFVTGVDAGGNRGYISFAPTAELGAGLVFTNLGGVIAGNGGTTTFNGEASAGDATFINEGGVNVSGQGGVTGFLNNSTAGHATIINNGGAASNATGGVTEFYEDSTAGNGTFINNGGTQNGAVGGIMLFEVNATAGHGTFTNNGGAVDGAEGSITEFSLDATAGHGVFTNNAGAVAGAEGAVMSFLYTSTAGNATLIANGGPGVGTGASIRFYDDSTGGSARVEVFGNGSLDISPHDGGDVTIGSLEGNGNVLLETNNLLVGHNNASTRFSGKISGSGSVTKVGTGDMALTNGQKDYSGDTHVQRGTLLISNQSGSATGTGDVFVDGGILGGTGIIGATVTVGTGGPAGAALRPGRAGPTSETLSIQGSLVLSPGSAFQWVLNSNRNTAGAVSASGATTSGALLSASDAGNTVLPAGSTFTIINNTGATAIVKTFANLADGATITVGNNTFQANYEGGDGNDLTLTVVP